MSRSSAYKSALNFVPFGKTNGSDKVFSKQNGMLLMNRLNNNGLKIQPWRTPLAYWKGRVLLFPIFMEHVDLNANSSWNYKSSPQHLFVVIWITVRHAKPSQKLFWIPQNRFVDFKKAFDLFVVVMHVFIQVLSVRTWSTVRFLGKKPIWDLWSTLLMLTCSRSLWYKIEQKYFPRQLETQISR